MAIWCGRTMPQHDLCDCQHRDRRGNHCRWKLLLGSHDFAGEIGHMIMVENGPLCGCGRRAALKRSPQALRLPGERSGAPRSANCYAGTSRRRHRPDRLRCCCAADAAGDALASEILDEAIRYLSIGLGNLVTIFNPDRIVIGGGVSNIGDRLFRPLRRMILSRAMRESVSRVEIHRAKLGSDVGVVGAMCLVMD